MTSYHAWFSREQFEFCGGNHYSRDNGDRVLISCVSESANPMVNYDDLRYCGIVTKWISGSAYQDTPYPDQFRDDEDPRYCSIKATRTNICNECGGTGEYVGFTTVEPCRSCQ